VLAFQDPLWSYGMVWEFRTAEIRNVKPEKQTKGILCTTETLTYLFDLHGWEISDP